ncbi:uncharacterized protein LOC111327355 [Stylophora pistillata]|uniref:uncharacterized protein LOC111327355 n=1 Tax=Stylophora pistillata TaxID=50429 RepID=UPI000C049D33|nr:uncharacterized protein LOC111327355 [Stylophora pistillata]
MEEAVVEWVISKGTNVTFTISPGDGSAEHTLHTSTNGFFKNSFAHRYTSAGVYIVSIGAKNAVEDTPKIVECTVSVEDPIDNLTLEIPVTRIKIGSQDLYIAVDESITVVGSLTRGTSVLCHYDFGEQVLTGEVDSFSKTYAYSKPGIFTVSLNCSNSVSSMYKESLRRIIVQKDEPIDDLQVMVPATAKGHQSVISLLMSSGTAFVCDWNLGDNTTFQTDVSDIGKKVLHQYAKEGPFDVIVSCKTRHGIVRAHIVAWVQIPIAHLTCTSLHHYIMVSQETLFNISVHSGSKVTAVAEFENDQRQSVIFQESFLNWKSFILKHSFSSNGSYSVMVKAANLLGSLTTNCTPIVVVQNPLANITLTPDKNIIQVSDLVAFRLTTTISRDFQPSHAACSWSFENNSYTTDIPLIFTEGEHTTLHRYMSPGEFTAKVSCSNKVSRIELKTNVTVLKLIEPAMTICLDCDHFSDLKRNPFIEYFALGDTVTLSVSSQSFDRAYHWRITEYGNLTTTEHHFLKVVLNKTGTFTASVLVDKLVATMAASVRFIVQEKINGIILRSSGFTWLRSATRFEFTLSKFDDGSCFNLTLNDSLNTKKSQCSEGKTRNYFFSCNHTYLFEGNYTVCLVVFNKVSKVIRCLGVEVSKPVCKIENVSISARKEGTNAYRNSLKVLKYKRSDSFELQGIFINGCFLPTSKNIKLLWIIKRKTSESKEPEVEGEDSGSVLKIGPRSLQYGSYEFQFVVELVSLDVIKLYGKVAENYSINVQIVRSPLVGEISGEKKLNLSTVDTLRLVASFHDPDLPPTMDQQGMVYYWYCKTPVGPLAQAEHFVHCYDDALKPENFIRILSYAEFTTRLNSYHENRYYIFTVVVTKYDLPPLTDNVTVFVSPPPPSPPPPPPTMEISCLYSDCPRKVSPSVNLRLKAVCVHGCGVSNLFYRWQFFIKMETEFKSLEFPSELNVETDDDDFIVHSYIFENILGQGGEGLVQVEVWRDGGQRGFSNKTITVNEPPIPGNCSCIPSLGEGYKTNFQVVCDSWIDPDKPLRYSFSYGDGKTVLTSTENPSSSKPFKIYKQPTDGDNSILVRITVSVEDSLGMRSTMSVLAEVKKAEKAAVDLGSLINNIDSESTPINNEEQAGEELQVLGDTLAQLQLSSQQNSVSKTAVSNAVTTSRPTVNQNGDKEDEQQNDKGMEAGDQSQEVIATTPRPTMSPEQIQYATIIEKSISKLSLVASIVAKSNKTTVSDFLVLSDTLETATANTDMLTLTARDDSARLLSEITKAVLNRPDAPLSFLERMAATIMRSAVNMLRSLARGPSISRDGTIHDCDDLVKERSRNASKEILKAINNMCEAILKSKTPGDGYTVINTTAIEAKLQKTLVSFINNLTIVQDLGKFTLPKDELFPDTNHTRENTLGLQMVSFVDNPYQNCDNDNITSSVVALELKETNGSNLLVSGLKNEIDIRIHHKWRGFDSDREAFVLQLDEDSSNFHTFNYSFPLAAVAVEFLSSSKNVSSWEIMITPGRRPTAEINLVSWSFKDKGRTFFLLESSSFTEMGKYFLRVKATPRTLMSPAQKNVSVNVSYSLKISVLKCLYWDNNIQGWNHDGCRVGPETRSREIQCLCNHLTSFAAQVVVEPNFIEFEIALKGFVELTENHLVFSVVLSILGVYILLLIWARRRDIRNKKKAETIPLADNDLSDRYKYEILVLTGMKKEAGTTADVFCNLIGLDAESGPRQLKDSNQTRFQRSGMDSFHLTTPEHLGDLIKVTIWHNNSGCSPSWYLKQIIVRDLKTDGVFVFMCNRWLAVEFDDGEVLRTLLSAKQDELRSFNHLFHNVTQSNIKDNHLWFSVFLRPQLSTFTTVQRLSCCLALLYCTMLTNAMFYQLGEELNPSNTLQLGPITLSLQQLYIGMISGLIIFPINIAIVSIFRNIEPTVLKGTKGKTSKGQNTKRKKRAQRYQGDFNKDIVEWYRSQDAEEEANGEGSESITVGLPPVETVDTGAKTAAWLNRNVNSCDSQSSLAVLEEADWLENDASFEASEDCDFQVQFNEKPGGSLKRKKSRKLPHWCACIAWFGVFAVSFTSAFFVVFYGFQFGREKSAQWLASLLVSLFQDIFISQPIKVLFVALIIALLIKKPIETTEKYRQDGDDIDEDEDELGIDNFEEGPPEYKKFMFSRYDHQRSISLEPPNVDELNNAREQKKREIRMFQLSREIILYVLFLLALFSISFGQRDPKAFLIAKLIEDTYLGGVYTGQQLYETDGIDNYWTWLEGTVLPSISSSNRDWAAGCHPLQEYTIDCNSRLVGGARVRQLRISEESCEVPGPLRGKISTCNEFYSFFKEDEDSYLPGWQIANVTAEANTTSNATISPWIYQTSDELRSIPFLGLIGTYSGGGYAFDLSSANVTDAYLNNLKQNSWIDYRTRAVFVEVAIYNAQVNLFGVATFLTEWMPTNGIVYFNNIKVARLYQHGNDLQLVMLVCEIFLAVFVLVFMYIELKKIFTLRRSYLKDPWNWLEIAQIFLTLTCAGALLQRTNYTNQTIERMNAEPDKFVSFIETITWDEIFGYLLAFLVFFANLKLLKLMKFNHRIYLFTKTISNAAGPLMSFMIVFAVFYIAYCVLFYSLFGSILPEYSSLLVTIETLFNTVMGAFDFEIIKENNRTLGPIIFFSFMMIMVMILLNVFLTILMDSFAEVQEDELLESEDAVVVDMMIKRLKCYFVRTDKVDILQENEALSRNHFESETNINSHCDSESKSAEIQGEKYEDEQYLDQSHSGGDSELGIPLRAAKAAEDSFSSIEKVGDSRQENLREPEHSSSWSSFTSLAKEWIETETGVDITTPRHDEARKIPIDDDTSGVCSESYGQQTDSRRSSMASNMERDEPDEKFYEEYSSSVECSPRGSHHSKFTDILTVPKSRRSSSSGYCSSFVATDGFDGSTELSRDSQLSHYYDMIEKALDNSNVDYGSLVGTEEGNGALEPEVSYYYKLLEGATRDREGNNGNETRALEKFDFNDYQICNNNFEGHSTQDCEKDNVIDVEPKLTDLLGFFASMALSDLLEDQVYEQLLVEYVTSLNEIWFEPEHENFERKLLKRFDKKAKWMYTRHMFTET